MSAKFEFGADSVPSTLQKGTMVIVNGVTYVGNSDNEPVPSRGYREINFVVNVDDSEESIISQSVYSSDFEGLEFTIDSGSQLFLDIGEAISGLNIVVTGGALQSTDNSSVIGEFGSNGNTIGVGLVGNTFTDDFTISGTIKIFA